MKYEILKYGNKSLRKKSEPVDVVNELVRDLVRDMLKTMYARKGVGLAAEQIGRTEAVCVIDVPPQQDVVDGGTERENPGVEMPLVMINPRIVGESGSEVRQEGCLSFPEIYVKVKRAAEVDAEYVDERGKRRTVHARGLLARAIQHELDHLNGVLLVDRMSTVQKVALAGKLKRLKKEGMEE